MVLESVITTPSQVVPSRRKTQPHSASANNLYVSYGTVFALPWPVAIRTRRRRDGLAAPPEEPCHREQRAIWETSGSGGDIPRAFRLRCRGQRNICWSTKTVLFLGFAWRCSHRRDCELCYRSRLRMPRLTAWPAGSSTKKLINIMWFSQMYCNSNGGRRELARSVVMHVAAMSPMAVTRTAKAIRA